MKCDKCGTIVSNGIEDGEGHKTCEACWRREGAPMICRLCKQPSNMLGNGICGECAENAFKKETMGMVKRILCLDCGAPLFAWEAFTDCHDAVCGACYGKRTGMVVFSATPGERVTVQTPERNDGPVFADERPAVEMTNQTLKISVIPMTAENVVVTKSLPGISVADRVSTGITTSPDSVERRYIVEGAEVSVHEYAEHVTKGVDVWRKNCDAANGRARGERERAERAERERDEQRRRGDRAYREKNEDLVKCGTNCLLVEDLKEENAAFLARVEQLEQKATDKQLHACARCSFRIRAQQDEQGAGIAKVRGVGRSMVLPVDVDWD